MNKKIICVDPGFYVYEKDKNDYLIKKYNIKHIKNKLVSIVLYKNIIPIITRKYVQDLIQDSKYKVLFTFNSNSFKKVLFSKYDIWISENLYSPQTLFSFFITKFRGKKFGILVKEWKFKKRNFIEKLMKLFIKLFLKKADFYISYSTNSKLFLQSKLQVDSKSIYNCPKNWYDLKDLYYKNNKKLLSKKLNESKIKLLFVGRLIPVKGVDVLLKGLKNYSDEIQLTVVGNYDGDYGKYCKRLVEEFDLDVLFLGKIKDKKILSEYYNACDVFVLPNKFTYDEFEPYEIWGSVVDEAMSFSKPIIVTNATGCSKDLIKDNGVVIKQNSIKAVEYILNDLVEDKFKWVYKGKSSKKILLEKNKKCIENYESLFEYLQKS